MSEIIVTTLSENTAKHGFIGEWGLSMLVEVDGMKILVDSGWGFSAAYNAQLLGIDLDGIDIVVLSHGHRDHTGGLPDILKRRKKPVDVIAHPDIFTCKYTRFETGDEYSGIPYAREYLESLGARFKLSKDPVRIASRVTTTGEIPVTNDFEIPEQNLLVKDDRGVRIDPLNDDQSLIIDSEEGLIIITGCAHSGIINTIRHARKITGRDSVYAIIGGTHLFRAPAERIALTIDALKENGPRKLGVSHCTGFQASAALYAEFPGAFFLNNAGTQTTL
jgi:7,8-dihydropterin-6-yl-methyl-4-(beta-D-ribofuranosyl)aminobenzene 5'-phosphate synthase